MLSEKLRNVTRTLARHAKEGTLTPEVFRLGLAQLDGLAGDVEKLENSTLPPVPRLPDELPANVIRMARTLHRQGVTAGMPEDAA
jgi:hypothetical protein